MTESVPASSGQRPTVLSAVFRGEGWRSLRWRRIVLTATEVFNVLCPVRP